MEELTQLQTELTTLTEFIDQRLKAINKADSNPEYLRMVLPPYDGELIVVCHIKKLIQKNYEQ